MARPPHRLLSDEIRYSTENSPKTPLRDKLRGWVTLRNELVLVGVTLAIASIMLFRAAYLIDGDESKFYFRAGTLTAFAGVITCWVIYLAHSLRQAKEELAAKSARIDAHETRIKDLEERMECRELVRRMLEDDQQATKTLSSLLKSRGNWGD